MKTKNAFLAVCMNPTLQKTLCFNRLIPSVVNRTSDYRFDASGKGINVTRVLSQLGKKVTHLTQLGGILRPVFLELCEKEGINVRWVESGSAIRFCYTIISGNLNEEHTVTELVEESVPTTDGTGERLLAAYNELLDSVGTVIISGTKAQGLNDALIPEMVRLARECDKRIILDIRGNDLKQSLVFRPDVVKPNLFEFAGTFLPELGSNANEKGELTGEEPGVKDKIAALVLELAACYGTNIVLTRGKYSVWYTYNGNFFECPVENEKPAVNTIGCGDAFTAGIAAALDDGLSLPDAVARGVHCGNLKAGILKPGTIL